MLLTIFELIVIIQIVVESIPVSSSGHCNLLLLLAHKHLMLPYTLNEESLSILHIPTLATLGIVFWGEWTAIAGRLFSTLIPIVQGQPLKNHSFQWLQSVAQLLCFAIVSDFLSLIAELSLKKLLPHLYAPYFQPLMLAGFCITSLLLLSLRWVPDRGAGQLTLSKAIILGLAQSVALLPGVSRLGTTFVVGRWLGLTARHSMLYSCTMSVGLIIGAFSRTLLTSTVPLTQLWQPFWSLRVGALLVASTLASIFVLHSVYMVALADKLWWLGTYMLAPISLLIWLMIA